MGKNCWLKTTPWIYSYVWRLRLALWALEEKQFSKRTFLNWFWYGRSFLTLVLIAQGTSLFGTSIIVWQIKSALRRLFNMFVYTISDYYYCKFRITVFISYTTTIALFWMKGILKLTKGDSFMRVWCNYYAKMDRLRQYEYV